MPLYLHVDVDARTGGIERYILDKCRVLKMFFDTDDCAQRAILDQLHFVSEIEVPMLIFKVGVDVPGIPALRLVGESLEQIAANLILRAAGIGFRGCQRFLIVAFVEQAGHASGARIDFRANEFVLQRVTRCPQRRKVGRGVRNSAHKICRVAKRRRACQQ